MTADVPERFWSKVDYGADDECWLWTGAIGNGYGRFTIGRKEVRAHRWAYEALVGPVPPSLDIDHLCRVRACVNPAHLEPVSRRENLLRGDTITARNAARTHCPQGHPYDESNTKRRRGGRECRRCAADSERRRRAR